ncbi:MAG TPA: hypothetical protein VEG42_03520 [Thermoplasmata archaeon]|nr:hypothetical protein [Thermoplasmata archaeon]
MILPLPTIVYSSALLPYVVIALSMVGITIFLIGKVLPPSGVPPLVTQMVLALAVLAGGSLLLLSLLFVFLNPDGTEAWTFVLLAFNFMMMFPAGIWFVSQILFRDQRVDVAGWFWPVTLSVVTTGSEALMGILFAYGAVGGATATVPALATGLSSVWFFWSMAGVMGALLVWAPLGVVERYALLTLSAASVLAPWVTSYPVVGGLAMSVLMGGSFLALVRALLLGRVAADEGRLLVALALAFLAMTSVGFLVVLTGGAVFAALAFGVVMGVVMGVEVAYLIHRYYRGTIARPWLLRRSDDSEVATAEVGARVPATLSAPATERTNVVR